MNSEKRNWQAKWIIPGTDFGDVCPCFTKTFSIPEPALLSSAELFITALGVYEASLNGRRIGDFFMAPGWTAYNHRLQFQEYNVLPYLQASAAFSDADISFPSHHPVSCAEAESPSTLPCTLSVTVGRGWYRGRIPGWETDTRTRRMQLPPAFLAELVLTYQSGETVILSTDDDWHCQESPIRFAEIYDGEIYDASFEPTERVPVKLYDPGTPFAFMKHMTAQKISDYEIMLPANDGTYTLFDTLIPQEGERITEQDRLIPARIFTTPNHETVLDFGQNLSGYIELSLHARKGDVVDLSFAEVLDDEGNFYTDNYRDAKCRYHYICCEGRQTYRPHFTFFGFRYVRINAFPGGTGHAWPEYFTAVTVHSDLKRTGYLSCSDPMLNQLFSNTVWGQKGNFIDVPTDCPQRDERLGWTGDAQVFTRTAALHFDVEKFYRKWMADIAAEQRADGDIPHVVPNVKKEGYAAAWSDSAVICPWEIYLAYGDKELLARQFDCAKRWVDCITGRTGTPYLWTNGEQYGDWLALDAPVGSYKGSSRDDFIASAFYARSVSLLIKIGKALDMDMAEYETLHKKIVGKFRETYPDCRTQTEYVLALYFGLSVDPESDAAGLAELIRSCGTRLQTGFIGTPYLLHVLSQFGYHELAYTLLLRTEYPSWLYPVTKGATTIWEHWDGIMEDGSFWSRDMNSFNHYAYGCVADWVYTKAAGIQIPEDGAGYTRIRFAPVPDIRLHWLNASLETRQGLVRSEWRKQGNYWRYEIETPSAADVIIQGTIHSVLPGTYIFFSEL